MNSVLAVDLGGTKLAVGIVDGRGRILASAVAPTRRGSPADVVAQARELAASLDPIHASETRGPGDSSRTVLPRPQALGLSLPGILDPSGQVLLRSPSSGWSGVPFTSLFSEAFGLPAAAGNDANACALAESVMGGAKGMASFFWMTVSTGVGGACFVDGRVLRGFRGMAGEVGHLVVRPGGSVCTCGNSGCLEAEAAGPAWTRKAIRIAPAWKGAAEAVAADARSGGPLGLAVVDDVAEALARGIGAVIDLFDPEAVFLGGGVAEASDLLIPKIGNLLPALILRSGTGGGPRILKSALGREAGLLGAACLALRAT